MVGTALLHQVAGLQVRRAQFIGLLHGSFGALLFSSEVGLQQRQCRRVGGHRSRGFQRSLQGLTLLAVGLFVRYSCSVRPCNQGFTAFDEQVFALTIKAFLSHLAVGALQFSVNTTDKIIQAVNDFLGIEVAFNVLHAAGELSGTLKIEFAPYFCRTDCGTVDQNLSLFQRSIQHVDIGQ